MIIIISSLLFSFSLHLIKLTTMARMAAFNLLLIDQLIDKRLGYFRRWVNLLIHKEIYNSVIDRCM